MTAPSETRRGRNQDRKLIARSQTYEVVDAARKTGISHVAVRKVIKEADNSRKKVTNALRGQ